MEANYIFHLVNLKQQIKEVFESVCPNITDWSNLAGYFLGFHLCYTKKKTIKSWICSTFVAIQYKIVVKINVVMKDII